MDGSFDEFPSGVAWRFRLSWRQQQHNNLFAALTLLSIFNPDLRMRLQNAVSPP